MPGRFTPALAAALLALAFAPAASRAATPAPCDLLPAKTAATLAGEAVGAPKDIQGKGCTYTAKSGAVIGLVVADMAPDDAKNYMSAILSMVTAPATTESVSGLGEQNFLLVRPDSQHNKNALLVIYHGKSLTLGVQRKMTPDLKAAMVQAMRQILSKI
jgi:hypothetical protein